jgi:hypothetical protein
MEKQTIKSLPPSEFTFGKYGLDIPFKIRMDKNSFIKWLSEQSIIGYCDAGVIPVRPRLNEIVIMIEIDDWQAWTHISKDEFDGLVNKNL